ncbi:MAG TPA: hypothetical protein VNG69_00725 [Casimicrobiaceae bacterium]|nr:hypothetical protein [Casimicrobiaceae bacterium]
MQAKHNEWLIDESIRGTFPASDPVGASQPGSLPNRRYAAQDRSLQAQRGGEGFGLIVVAACIALCAGVLLGRRR